MRQTLAAVAFVLFGTVGLSSAAPAAQRPPPSPTAVSQPAPPPSVDVDRLPIDLQRIERQLRKDSERSDFDGLRLRYFVDVYGQAPRIELFAPGDDLANGPVPWGAPTHDEMVEHVTPKEFRSPRMDLNALMRWLSDKLGK